MTILDNIIATLPPLVVLAIIGLLVSLFVTLVSKFVTNQKALKLIKAEIKSLRATLKEVKHDIGKVNEINKKILYKNSEQLRHSLRSLFFTAIPLLFVITWMHGNVALDGIAPGDSFSVLVEKDKTFVDAVSVVIDADGASLFANDTKNKTLESGAISSTERWFFTAGEEGIATLSYTIMEEESYTQEVLVTSEWKYKDTLLEKDKKIVGIRYGTGELLPTSPIYKITVELAPVYPFGGFSLFGWRPGWLFTYIFFTLIFSLLLRKVFNVH